MTATVTTIPTLTAEQSLTRELVKLGCTPQIAAKLVTDPSVPWLMAHCGAYVTAAVLTGNAAID